MSKHFKHLTTKEYEQIKELRGLGMSLNKVASITKRSVATVHSISNSDNFQDYKTKLTLRYKKPAPKAIEREPLDVFTPVETVPAPPSTAHEGTEATSLLRIANALERLADAWENKPKRKFF